MLGVGLAGIGIAVKHPNTHLFHQGLYPLATDGMAILPQQVAQHPTGDEGLFEMQFIDPAHQRQMLGRHRLGRVIHRRAGNPENRGLLNNR